MLFHYSIDEKNYFWPVPLYVWSLHLLPMTVWVFSGDRCFLPHPKDAHMRSMDISQLSQFVGCGVGVCEPCSGRGSCPGWVPLCSMSSWDWLWPLMTLNWNNQVENNDLTCLYKSLLNIWIARISMSNVRSVWVFLLRSLVIFLWLEIYHRN